MTEHILCFNITSPQGQRFGWTQYQCDKRFKSDMYRLCEKKYGSKKRWFSWPTKYKRCKFFARWYYRAVRVFGRFHWTNPSEHWCRKGCTKALGNPFKPLKVTDDNGNDKYISLKLENYKKHKLADLADKWTRHVVQGEIKDCSRAYVYTFLMSFHVSC